MNGHSASQVMGDLGTGKSTLVNALLNEPDCFGVSSQAAAFTKGVDVTEPRNFDTCGHKVVFADMEGRSDKGRAYDVKLATPVLLSAKAVVLNIVCPTRPSKVQILEMLELPCNGAGQLLSSSSYTIWSEREPPKRSRKGASLRPASSSNGSSRRAVSIEASPHGQRP